VPVDWTGIARVTERWGAVLIEDAAQGLGTSWRGHRLGTLGALRVRSFGRGKGWTGGSGGAVLCRVPAPWNEQLTLLGRRSVGAELLGLGAAFTQWAFGRPGWFGVPASVPAFHLGETRYRHPRVARPLRRGAAMLLLRTRAAALLESERRRVAGDWLGYALPYGRGIDRITPPEGGIAGWLRFPLLREAARAGLAAGYPRILPELPAVVARLTEGARAAEWPGARRLVRQLVTLPTHSFLSTADHVRIVGAVDGYLRGRWGSAAS
jgi:hypothetical protein